MALKINFSKQEIEKILSMYLDDGLPQSRIAKHFNVNPKVISRILKENDIKPRDNSFYRTKYSFNEDYFNIIDTEDKAYWLGFIYADGYITKNKVFGIKISDEDYLHLEKFKNNINSNHPIHFYNSTNGYNTGKRFCQIEFTNKKNVFHLINKGVIPRKTKILKFPDSNILSEKLIRHFIRGYFDGDGSIYKFGVSFVGTYDFLIGVKDHLPIDSIVEPYKYKNKNVYELKLGGTNILKDIYDYFYTDSMVWLDRKYEKFTKIIEELNKRKKRTILTTEDVKEIKRCLLNGMKQSDIAERFKINVSTVSAIKTGKNHADITI